MLMYCSINHQIAIRKSSPWKFLYSDKNCSV